MKMNEFAYWDLAFIGSVDIVIGVVTLSEQA